ncbi:hypothetical protein MXB_4942, partial [Myxobolus squamalis]
MIIGLATEEPPYSVPSKAHDLYITADFTNQTSEQTPDEICTEIKEADVICLVYSLTDQNTCKRVSEYWLPLVEEVCKDAYKPVVIVGNKKTVFKNLLYRQTLQELRDTVSHNVPDGLTADGRATHVSPDITLRALSILGFNKGEWHTSLNALQTTTTQLYNHYDYGMRTTFVCSVFGNSDCGKSSFIRSLLGYSSLNAKNIQSCSIVAVVNIDDIKKNSFIIFEEVPWYSAEDHVTTRPFHMCILLFDASEPSSFQFCLEIHSRLPRNTPCMFIATKKDISVVDQLTDVDPQAYCVNASRFPLIYCSINSESQQFFSDLLSEISCFMALGFRQKKRKIYLIT